MMNQRVKETSLLASVAALVLLVDQTSKALVAQYLPPGMSWAPIPALQSWFSLTHVLNTGAAFGLFPQLGSAFLLIAVVVVVGIVLYSRHLTSGQRLVTVSLGLQLGGALGNLVDRLRIGHVVDFLDFKVWPVFNLADSSIVVGVALMMWTLFRMPEQFSPPSPDLDADGASMPAADD